MVFYAHLFSHRRAGLKKYPLAIHDLSPVGYMLMSSEMARYGSKTVKCITPRNRKQVDWLDCKILTRNDTKFISHGYEAWVVVYSFKTN